MFLCLGLHHSGPSPFGSSFGGPNPDHLQPEKPPPPPSHPTLKIKHGDRAATQHSRVGAHPFPGMRPLWPAVSGKFLSKRVATTTFQSLAELTAVDSKRYRRSSALRIKIFGSNPSEVLKAKSEYADDECAKSPVESVRSRLAWWQRKAKEHSVEAYPITVAETDFGQTTFGHHYFPTLAKSDFGQTDFGQP